MLWSFLNIKLNIPVDESLKLFGRHTTYRHNSNIDVDVLASIEKDTPLDIEYIKLLVDNPYVSDKVVAKHYGPSIEVFFKSNWRVLLATLDPSEYGNFIMEFPGRFKPNNEVSEYLREALSGVLKYTPDIYYRVLASIFSFSDYNSPELLVQHIAKYHNNRLLESIPLTKEVVESMIDSNLYKVPMVGSALIANGGLEKIKEKVTDIESWMSLADTLNLGIELDDEELPINRKHSKYAKVKFLPSVDNTIVLFSETSYERYDYLSLFEPSIRLELIKDLIRSGEGEEVEHYYYTALALLNEDGIAVDEELLNQLVMWAISYEEPRNIWRLFFYDKLPETLRDVLEPYLSNK